MAKQASAQEIIPSTDESVTLQFLTFTIGAESYGVDIMKVREIKGWEEVTRLPNSPEYMRGVMNLRGIIIPIFDLRARFGMGLTHAHDKNVVIILAVGQRTVGILVDAVSDILTTSSSEIKPPPSMDTIDAEYLNGLISIHDRMVAILDAEHLFKEDSLELADAMAGRESITQDK